ncbi:amidase signature enzyme [Cantharellus anzutake]|uniref:amidase signature enzyme n=1 Tax=Cantharellus anzutake TaxID=1750568 RepID=UPI001904C78B|nr:amidase signature enzyme [Cantharellus anzutake]KAF8325793.1 amidase signature enzyme [Cantharellus anzutake]
MGWKQVANKKRQDRDGAIARFRSDDTDTLNEYTRANGAQIVEHIKNRDTGWTAENVLRAYIRRAIVAHEETNCITEVMFVLAIEEARRLDEEFANTGVLRGPLHGVPISLKDLYHVQGVDSTIGFTRWAYKPRSEDGDLVAVVREAGGIPFLKTNVPQTLLSFECVNPLWGRTSHPLKTTDGKHAFTCGGSSGGEVALLALDGSPLGFASDVGGSLRIPTHFSGVYSIKPTPGRITHHGVADPYPGFEAIPVCFGPMGRSVADIKLSCEALFGKSRARVPLPFRKELNLLPHGKKLRIGYYLSDGIVKASPSCQRAVIQTVKALRAAGHECVLFGPPNVLEAMRIFIALTAADGYKTLTSHIGPDPPEPSLFLVTLGPKLPKFLRELAAFVAEKGMKDPLFAHCLRNSRRRSVRQFMEAAAEMQAYNDMWNKNVWEAHGFDAIIAPAFAVPALPHGMTKTLSPLAVATFLYNVVESAVGVIPVTRVDPQLDQLTEEWEGPFKPKSRKSKSATPAESATATSTGTENVPANAEREFPHDSGPHGSKMIEAGVYYGSMGEPKAYRPDEMEGLPIGIQIIGRPFDDEKIIALMSLIDGLLGERGFGPGSSSKYA